MSWSSPCVYQTIEHLRRLLYEVGLVWIVLQLVVGLEVEDHVQRLSVVRDLLVQARQVELVLDVILINLAEKLISPESTEPRDPGDLSGALQIYFVFILVPEIRNLPLLSWTFFS